MEQTDTIAAIATAPGYGGIGIIRLSGPKSVSIAVKVCQQTPANKQVHVCSFYDDSGAVIDNGIMLYFQSPASYTGEDVVELQGHGGPVVLSMLLRQVINCGARQAKPGEFTERAFLNNKIDLAQAEAVAELINSKSEQAARNARATLAGVFSSLVHDLLNKVIDSRVYVESLLDFPEEEIEAYNHTELAQYIHACLGALQAIIRQSKNGRLYTQGVLIAILGQPNTGKSTLLNRLSGAERAIVSDQAGTTRDTLEQDILINDIPFRLIDTAGIRASIDSIEAAGIRRAMDAAKQADIILYVADLGRANNQAEEVEVENVIAETQAKVIRVHNKTDLVAKEIALNDKGVFLCAKTGEGIDLLRQAIMGLLLEEDATQTHFAAQQRQVILLQGIEKKLQTNWQTFSETKALELLAEDLRKIQKELSKLTGEFVADDLLGEIFSRFCIGK